MEQTPEQLKSMAGLSGDKKSMFDAEIPVWMMNIITAILGDIRYGRTTTLDSLFDRIFGKASHQVEATISNVDARSAHMSDEELMEEIEKIERALRE